MTGAGRERVDPPPGGDVADLLATATAALTAAGVATARVDAELLTGHVLGVSRGRVQALALLGARMDAAQLARFADLVDRRAARQPLQHITGVAHFRALTLQVGPGVFVPRPETEVVAGLAIEALRSTGGEGVAHAVDLATGSGAIALALAAEVPWSRVIGVERDGSALEWALRNVTETGLSNVSIVDGDLATALPERDGTIDVVVSNPPYIPDGMVPRDAEVRLFDPPSALFGGLDGLDPMRAVVATAARLLRSGGVLVVEHGEHQGAAVRALLGPAWLDATTHPDLTGRDRATTARRT